MRTNLLQTFVLGLVSGIVACGPEDSVPLPGTSGGTPSVNGGSGGSTSATSGGNGSGGTVASGNGGAGIAGSGIAGASSGGAVATGGSSASNGGATNGGNGAGGATNGGNGAGGSTNGPRGGASNGGQTASGGSSSGGRSSGGSSNGGTSTGGASSGGKASSGGASSGGASSGGASSTCTEAQKTLNSNETGKHCGYTYEYWKDSGSGSLVLTADGFNVNWSNINNLLGRKGIRPGTSNLVATYTADYNPNGNSYLCIYGWTRSPLVEYYIVDSWGDWRPPGSTSMGTVDSDGGTYDIYRTQRVQQPSIDGTQTFYQYWSVRTAKRTSGNITVGNHFKAWTAKGLNMGSLYEVSMTVEGYQSSGTASVKMSIK